MNEQTQKEKQTSLDQATIFNRLADFEDKQKKMKERILKAEVLIDSITTGQQIICTCLENAGLMTGNGEPAQPASSDPGKIAWKEAEGAKGKYDRYPAEGEKAESTDDYKNILADLKKHDGRMTRDGYFYWLFTDSATIGRKRKGKKTKKAVSPDIEAVKAEFPSDLAELLSFEAEEHFTVLKPRRFLGSENFAKIAAVVRELGGEYISKGKDSHFKIPRKK